MAWTIPPVITGSEPPPDPVSPYAALETFYRAFNQRDMAGMAGNWLHSEVASMANPLGGIKHGWAEIAPVYQRIFTGQAHVYVEFYDYCIHEADGMFCAVGRERGYFRLDDIETPLQIRTSRIFRQVDGCWRQLHHHGSMDDPALLQAYQSATLPSTSTNKKGD